MDRRQFMWGSLGILAASQAGAIGADSQVGIGILQHGQGHELRSQAVEQLLWEVSKRTSVNVRERAGTLRLLDPDLFHWPLLLWAGTGPCEPFSDDEVRRLRRHLRAGGTLYIDDATPSGDDSFDTCVRREMSRVWPERPLQDYGNDHTIYRTFFLLQKPFGRIDRASALQGITFDDRSPVLYNRNDLFGAFGRDTLGRWNQPVVPGGSVQREMAFRMGVNLVMYATCLNYKRDQVHTTAILRRRRWRIEAPRKTR